MTAVSQALIEFAKHHEPRPGPGTEVIATHRYQITLQPDFPIPGPNSVSRIRCGPAEADAVIAEVRATIAPRHLPVMWILSPETEPSDFAGHLAAHGIHPDGRGPESAVMVLPIDVEITSPPIAGLEIHDALADPERFRAADAAGAEGFGTMIPGEESELADRRERRRKNQLAAGNRRLLLATIEGEPAGTAGLTLFPPGGAIINGGAVRPKFRGRGIYRALVAARLEMAQTAGVAGLAVWGGPMSAPILARLGFETVGWRRFYPDTSAV